MLTDKELEFIKNVLDEYSPKNDSEQSFIDDICFKLAVRIASSKK